MLSHIQTLAHRKILANTLLQKSLCLKRTQQRYVISQYKYFSTSNDKQADPIKDEVADRVTQQGEEPTSKGVTSQSDEDYNIDDITKKDIVKRKMQGSGAPRGDNFAQNRRGGQRRYDMQDGSHEDSRPHEVNPYEEDKYDNLELELEMVQDNPADIAYLNDKARQLAPDYNQTLDTAFNEFKKSKQYQVQQRFVNLIEEQFKSASPDTQQYLAERLALLSSENQSTIIDSTTKLRISALINGAKFDEKQEFKKVMDAISRLGHKVGTSYGQRMILKEVAEGEDIASFERLESEEYDSLVDQQMQQAEMQFERQNEGRSLYLADENQEIFDINKELLFGQLDEISEMGKEQMNRTKLNVPEDSYTNEQIENLNKALGTDRSARVFDHESEEAGKALERETLDSLQGELKREYEQIKRYIQLNQELRRKVAFNVAGMRKQLGVTERQRNKTREILKEQSLEYNSDALPNKNIDLIQLEQQHYKERYEINQLLKWSQTSAKNVTANSNSVQGFIRQLKVLSRLALFQTDSNQKQKTLSTAQGLIKQMLDNTGPNFKNGSFNQNPKEPVSVLFEFSVHHKNLEKAMFHLKELVLSKNQYDNKNYINLDILKQYFTQCLKKDYFNGLSYLIAYVEQNQIDISSWDLNKFKSAVNFYLNNSFNLDNLLVFMKFYTYSSLCRLRIETSNINTSIHRLPEINQHELYQKVFTFPDIIDVAQFFNQIVNKLGKNQLIDPITKEDAVYKIISFFTDPTLIQIRDYGNNTAALIRDEDIALYFKNHFNDQGIFEKVTTTALRLSTTGSNFNDHIMQHLREFKTRNGSLPLSFESNKIRNAYVNLKQAKKTRNITIKDKQAEYLLFLLKSSELWPEIIDFSQEYNNLTGKKTDLKNEIQQYYLSDALLKMPSNQLQNKHYYQIINEAVFPESKDQDPTQGYIIAMTKAYFKDGNAEKAVSFFLDNIKTLKKTLEAKENYLISIYDTVFGDYSQKQQSLTEEQFTRNYYDAIQLANKSLRETAAVQKINEIISGKDYYEIDALFQLYIVQREEQALTQQYGIGTTQSEEQLSQGQYDHLSQVRQRKQILLNKLSSFGSKSEEEEILLKASNIVENNPITIHNDSDQYKVQYMQKLFPYQSEEELDALIKRSNKIYEVLGSGQQRWQKDVLNEFYHRRQQNIEYTLKQNMEEAYYERTLLETDINEAIGKLGHPTEGGLQKFYADVPQYDLDPNLSQLSRVQFDVIQGKIVNNGFKQFEIEPRVVIKKMPYDNDDEFADDEEDYIHMVEKHQFYEPIEVQDDPEKAVGHAHDQTLADMKDDLVNAINERKGSTLKIAVDIFNKIQKQTTKTVNLADISQQARDIQLLQKEEKLAKIDEILSKFQLLVNNQRSPLYQILQGNERLSKLENYGSFLQEYGSIGNVISRRQDLVDLQKINSELLDCLRETDRYHKALEHVNSQLIYESQAKIDERTSKNDYQAWKSKKEENLGNEISQRAKALFSEYQNNFSSNEKNSKYISREQKINLMRDVLSLELGQSFASPKSVFSSFYAQDLIIFGLENNIAESVRLGEKIMVELGETINVDLAMDIKNYLLDNSQKYRDAAKLTGRIDSTPLYKQAFNKKNTQEEAPVFLNLDDPYWKHFIGKNTERFNIWKTPSCMVWDHRPNGILDEIIDFKKFKEQYKDVIVNI